MSAGERLEAMLLAGGAAGFRALGWRRSLVAGAALGAAAHRLGLRASVARANLARAFPERTPEDRERILAAHYRELGRVVAEYVRLPEIARAPAGSMIASVRGLEHIERARETGRGAVLLSGHYGNFELLATFAAHRFPATMVVQPLGNPHSEAWIARERTRAGVGTIATSASPRALFRELHSGRMLMMLGDQDARRSGVFVPFLGVPASTTAGPARLALATGAALITGFIWRRADGRHEIEFEPPVERPDPRDPDAALTLTARHTARLEARVRRHPEHWFWVHRRWKTAPPASAAGAPEQEARRASV